MQPAFLIHNVPSSPKFTPQSGKTTSLNPSGNGVRPYYLCTKCQSDHEFTVLKTDNMNGRISWVDCQSVSDRIAHATKSAS